MQYQGGKARIKDWVVETLAKHHGAGQPYLEPFVGGAWIISNVSFAETRIGSDLDEDLIKLWTGLQRGWEPPMELSEAEYKRLRDEPPSALRGFAKFGCSWGGKPWGGYARSGDKNYAMFARNSLLRKKPKLADVVFRNCDYRKWCVENHLIYCDPPYEATTGYSESFDSVEFWSVMRSWSQRNTVIVSSYEAPEDFETIAQCTRLQEMRFASGRRNVTEKLFKLT